MMSAYNAVQENETVVIHGVKIEWQYYEGFALPTGSFTLSKKFCDDRQIKISKTKGGGEKTAFLCIRYCTQDIIQDCQSRYKNRNRDVSARSTKEATFVAHASSMDVTEQVNKTNWNLSTLTVFFEVNQMSGTFPKVLRKSGRQPKECTVEVIPVLYPDRYAFCSCTILLFGEENKRPILIPEIKTSCKSGSYFQNILFIFTFVPTLSVIAHWFL